MKLRRWQKREGQRGVCIPRQWHICIVIHVRAYLRVHFSPPILQSVQFTSRVSVSFSGFECLPFSVPVHPLFSLCPMPPSALLSLSILPLFFLFLSVLLQRSLGSSPPAPCSQSLVHSPFDCLLFPPATLRLPVNLCAALLRIRFSNSTSTASDFIHFSYVQAIFSFLSKKR